MFVIAGSVAWPVGSFLLIGCVNVAKSSACPPAREHVNGDSTRSEAAQRD